MVDRPGLFACRGNWNAFPRLGAVVEQLPTPGDDGTPGPVGPNAIGTGPDRNGGVGTTGY